MQILFSHSGKKDVGTSMARDRDRYSCRENAGATRTYSESQAKILSHRLRDAAAFPIGIDHEAAIASAMLQPFLSG